jgi:uncharacterized protein
LSFDICHRHRHCTDYTRSMTEELKVAGIDIALGETKTIELHLARLYDYTELTLPIRVIRGKEKGPTLFISGAVHGDEIIGASIVQRVINDKRMKNIKGSLIAIPIVNVFGFNTRSRYLPDRRDLNRCFPGTKNGSLASRVAYIFMEEVVKKSQFGIDFHSGAIHRANLPQIRASIEDKKTKSLAEAFAVPVIIDSKMPDGSLRQAAADLGVKMLLFEGGEALRLEERVAKAGVHGAFAVMNKIGMLANSDRKTSNQSYLARSSYWLRAPQSGMMRFAKSLGDKVRKDLTVGTIADAFGKNKMKVIAHTEGIIIGQTRLPLVNKGDALFHIATFEDSGMVQDLATDLGDYFDQVP